MTAHPLTWLKDGLHLFYPRICGGCGTDVFPATLPACVHCLNELPATGFESLPDNPVERLFFGRLPLESACSGFYFNKGGLLQQLLHQLKYEGDRQSGEYLGRRLGRMLKESPRWSAPDWVLPMPMHPKKQKKRGYNQAGLIAKEVARELGCGYSDQLVVKTRATETQTRKSRWDRWENVATVFAVSDIESLKGRTLLLVDDVITTGSSMESCGQVILSVPDVRLQLAAVALAEHG